MYRKVSDTSDTLKCLEWPVLGQALRGWRTLESIQMTVQFCEGDGGKDLPMVEDLRKDILCGMDPVKNILKSLIFV